MSVVSFALAVVFIIRLFSTSAFRVPKAEEKNKNMFTNRHIMISENNIGFLLVLFFAPNIINNLLHAMFF